MGDLKYIHHSKDFKEDFFFKLKEKVKGAPKGPGVYLIKNSFNQIIYIGKAKNLRSRAFSYIHVLNGILNQSNKGDRFQSSLKSELVKTERLVQKMWDIEFKTTPSEVDAFLLEAQLIKKHKPRYNIRLRDDKAYPYLCLNLKKDFPKIELSRRVKENGAFYFGPYTQVSVLRELMSFLNKTFFIRDCSDHFMKSRERPCLTHQMGFCEAPCVGRVSKSDYRKNIKKALNFLLGKNLGLKKRLEREMKRESKQEAFERAAQLRDRIESLEVLSNKHQKLDIAQGGDQDVIVFLKEKDDRVLIQFLHIRNFCVIGKNSHFISLSELHSTSNDEFFYPSDDFGSIGSNKNLTKKFKKGLKNFSSHSSHQVQKKVEFDLSEVISTYLFQFYEENFVPHRILMSEGLKKESVCILENFLRRKKKNISCILPSSKSFTKEDRKLLQKVKEEGGSRFKEFNRKFDLNLMALKEIQSFFKLDRIPYRIEAFDVSHFHGSNPVASHVVFERGEPKKSEYRHYKLRYDFKKEANGKKVKESSDFLIKKSRFSYKKFGKNDLKGMKEVLKRRFRNRDFKLPHLIVIDGGKGQLNQALQVLRDEGLEDKIFALGMAKARVFRDFKGVHLKASKERFYKPYEKNFLCLPEHSKALHLLISVRDEAHRFALRLQRKQRQKELKKS